MPEIKISPSILSANFGSLNDEIEKISNADWLHVDVMDGQFVPVITIGPKVVKYLKTELPLDVHLMINNPERQLKAFADAGAAIIVIHLESCDNPKELVQEIKALGVKAGIAINPATPIDGVLPFLDELDLLVVMSVVPGKGGQSFMVEVLDKVRLARGRAPELDIQVDGGINDETIKLAAAAGANVFVAGSYTFKHGPDETPADRVETLRRAAEEGRKQ